ncbi:MAG TPA: adenylate/guanylate cyclase domain-containing protein [Candidatus Udaeobacter sp.]|nr:adenylate/guanylate cyclase domain-containing protein [Candidatus Udaeobacter sp.]
MSISSEQRRLAAIMFTDMVGYTALSQRNEALALELLEQHRRILRSIFPRFNGTEIKTIGDAFLVEFQSALEAAQCALEIQRTLAKRNPDVSREQRIELRIGIHVGDIVHREGDVYGDGVNIASRIQPVAGIGGICISVDVERQIHNALEVTFEKLAPIELKNVQVPMDLFRVVLPWERDTRLTSQGQKPVAPRRSIPIGWLVAAVLLLLVIAGGWFLFGHYNVPSRRSGVTEVPAKSIAVLPFENLSRDPENEFFTDGVQDEILSDLAKVADLRVISRTSVMQYKAVAQRNLREIAQQLGVAHVVEGSVQRAANKVRVIAQLIDARNDVHLWAQTYDRDLADVFAIQSEIAKSIADQLQAKLSPAEKSAIEQRPTTDVAAFELYSRAKDLILNTGFSALAQENLRSGIDLLNQALARDPSFFAAQCQLASAHDSLYGLLDHTPERRALAEGAVDAAFRLRPDAGEVHVARAQHLYSGYRDYGAALAELDVARRTLSNDPRIFELTAAIMRRQGKHDEGLANYQRSVEIDPRNFFTLQQLALSYQVLRRYAEVIATDDRALSIKPDDPETRAARALAFLDWKADTRPLHQMIDEIRSKNPAAIRSVADVWFICALAERDEAAAETALTALGDATFGDNSTQFNSAFGRGLLGRMLKDESKAQSAFAALRAEQEKIVQAQPDYGPAVCILALIDAGLGRKEEALREIRRAVELVPVAKDSLNGADMIQYSAIVAAWVGEKDLALQNLAKAAQLPGFLSYGRLKLLPSWDPLRGDPRFDKIVASLAPKDSAAAAK